MHFSCRNYWESFPNSSPGQRKTQHEFHFEVNCPFKKKKRNFSNFSDSDVFGQLSPPLQPFHLPIRCSLCSSPSGYTYEAFQPLQNSFAGHTSPATDRWLLTGCTVQTASLIVPSVSVNLSKQRDFFFFTAFLMFPYHSYDHYMLGICTWILSCS